jgi:hypothetical protein
MIIVPKYVGQLLADNTLSNPSCCMLTPNGSMSHAHFAILLPIESIRSRLGGHSETRSGGQASDHTVRHATSNMTQIELSTTKVTLALPPNALILSKPRLPPLSLARQPVSQQCTSTMDAIYTAPLQPL